MAVRVSRGALVAAPVVGILLASVTTGVIVPVLVHAAVGVAILAACMLTGVAPLHWLSPPGATVVERGVMATAVGAMVLGLLLLALGLIGWLGPATTLTVTASVAVLSGLRFRPWRQARSAWSELESLFAGPFGLVLLTAGSAVFGAGLAAAVVPPWDWDSLMYHLSLPQQFLKEGSVLPDPINVHVAYVGISHMLYAVAIALGVPGAATVISTLFGLLLALSVYRVARDEMLASAAAVAVAGVAGTTVVALVAFTSRVDVSLALFLFLAHWAAIRGVQLHGGRDVTPGGAERWLFASAVFGAAALATKIHAGAYLVPLAAWVLWQMMQGRITGRSVVVAAALGVALMAPWIIRSWALFGDPIFPVLSGTGVPPWLRGDPEIARVAGTAGGVLARAREPVSIGRLLLEPGLLSPEAEARYYLWSPLIVAAILVVLASPASWRWAVPALVYGAIVLSRSLRTNLRYLIPILPALSVAAAGGVAGLLDRRPRLRAWILAGLFSLSLAHLVVPLTLVWRWIDAPVESGRYDTIYAAAAMTSERVPVQGTVLMLYEARGWPFDRTVIQDNRIVTWPLISASGHADDCLQRLPRAPRAGPVTHVLINGGALRHYRSRIGYMDHVSDGSLDRFIQQCLDPVDERGEHVLFQLRSTLQMQP